MMACTQCQVLTVKRSSRCFSCSLLLHQTTRRGREPSYAYRFLRFPYPAARMQTSVSGWPKPRVPVFTALLAFYFTAIGRAVGGISRLVPKNHGIT